MLHYPKEYEEAISRLNAPERSPLPYAPLPYGPVPNKCNYMNWNRIMAETRQGTLPKYSILQRIDFSTQNDLVNVSDAKEYTYTLDPSFTFAKGARKSIAVRAVDIYNVIPNGQTKTAREQITGKYKLNVTNNGTKTTLNIEFSMSYISYECSNDIAVSMYNFADAIGEMIYTNVNGTTNGNSVLSQDYSPSYNPLNHTITVLFNTNPDYDFSINSTTTLTEGKWKITKSNVFDMYNAELGAADIKYNFRKTAGLNQLYFQLKLPDDLLDFRKASVCGSINPWTKNNLIAPLTYSSDTLTKVFPYNGCTEARFWFINENGEKTRWRTVRGYIDLELIIDNSDSYAMTGDN